MTDRRADGGNDNIPSVWKVKGGKKVGIMYFIGRCDFSSGNED